VRRLMATMAGVAVSLTLTETLERVMARLSDGDSLIGCFVAFVLPCCFALGGYVTGRVAWGPYSSFLRRAGWAVLLNPGPWAAMLLSKGSDWIPVALYSPVSWLGAVVAMQTRDPTGTQDR
jgi:hypothetical protein